MLYTLNYINAQDFDKEIMIFDMNIPKKKKKKVTQCKIIIFPVTNDYIT